MLDTALDYDIWLTDCSDAKIKEALISQYQIVKKKKKKKKYITLNPS